MIEKIAKEIKEDYYQNNYSNDGQRFLAWYLRNIYNLNEDETKYDITDGPDDKQIDAVYIDDTNSIIHIIQGKYYKSSNINAEPLREVLSSWIQLKDLVKLQESANNKLKQRLADISLALDEEYDVEFELIVPNDLTESAKDDLKVFQEQIATSEDFSASLSIVNAEELERRYDIALGQENPNIDYTISLTEGKFIEMQLAGVNVVIAAIPLKECIMIPHIKDGALFKKNVRQSLGLNNQVNKGIKESIYNDSKNFFFYHNGVTAICTKMKLENNKLTLKGFNVVNGCQSLNTILSCSEKVKEEDNSYIMFRFYEVPDRETGDKISTSTNSQSAVKARDLRSNDKRVLAIKKTFEQKYSKGQLITKRGEQKIASRDDEYVIDIEQLGKYLMTWHSQRPNIAYSPTKIFDKYFDQLFKKDYAPEDVQALNVLGRKVLNYWNKDNLLGLNESLLAMRAYAPYHQLYGVSLFFSIVNGIRGELVIRPSLALKKLEESDMLDYIIRMSGKCLNTALINASAEPQPENKVFSPQNWIKTKKCLNDIRSTISSTLNMLSMLPENEEIYNKIKNSLKAENNDFYARWTAD